MDTSSAEHAGKGTGFFFSLNVTAYLCMFVHFCISSPVCILGIFFRFLNVKIQEGDAHNIFCPAYECYQLVPVHVIESVVSREMDQRYLQFDIKVKITHHALVY